jgi:hypothetical protein
MKGVMGSQNDEKVRCFLVGLAAVDYAETVTTVSKVLYIEFPAGSAKERV